MFWTALWWRRHRWRRRDWGVPPRCGWTTPRVWGGGSGETASVCTLSKLSEQLSRQFQKRIVQIVTISAYKGRLYGKTDFLWYIHTQPPMEARKNQACCRCQSWRWKSQSSQRLQCWVKGFSTPEGPWQKEWRQQRDGNDAIIPKLSVPDVWTWSPRNYRIVHHPCKHPCSRRMRRPYKKQLKRLTLVPSLLICQRPVLSHTFLLLACTSSRNLPASLRDRSQGA